MQDSSSGNKRIAKNSLFMSIRMVVVLVVSLYTTRVILNALGVDDFGVYNVVAGFVSMFAFLNNAMSSATQRFFNFELGKNGVEGARKVYCAAILIHLILAVVTILVAEPAGLWYLRNKMVLPEGRLLTAEWIFHFSAVSMFFTIMSAPFSAAVIAHEKMDFYAILNIADVLLKLGFAFLLLIIRGDKLWYYGLYFLLLTIINTMAYVIYCKKKFPEIKLGITPSASLFKEMLGFSWWSVFGSLAYMLREQGVNLVLNFFFGTIVNAARGVANQINGALQGFIGSIVTPSRPQVIQSFAKGDLGRTWNLTFSISKLTFLFFYLMSLPICFEIKFILDIWLGDAVPGHTATFVIILLITNTFGTLVSPMSTVMHATGKMMFYQILSSASNLMTVPLAYLFLVVKNVPEYAYVALFITCITNLLAGMISARKYAGLSFRKYLVSVILPGILVILTTVPFAFIPLVIMKQGFGRFVVEVILCVVVVCVSTYFIGLTKQEKAFVVDLAKKYLLKK